MSFLTFFYSMYNLHFLIYKIIKNTHKHIYIERKGEKSGKDVIYSINNSPSCKAVFCSYVLYNTTVSLIKSVTSNIYWFLKLVLCLLQPTAHSPFS